MIRHNKNLRKCKNESVEDPHELLLSLVDMGSLDVEDALVACVSEMSDAECKRVLGSLTLPACCDEVEVEDDDMMALDDAEDDMLIDVDDESENDEDADETEVEVEDEEDADEACNKHKDLEARIARLERNLRKESYRFNRK